MSGFTKSWRKELKGDIWVMPPLYHRVFFYLRQKAKWQPELFPTRKTIGIWVLPGQFLTSIEMIAKGVSWSEYGVEKTPNKKTVKIILDWLEKREMIQVISNGLGTMITVINWDTYQAKDIEEVTISGQGIGQRFTHGSDNGSDTIKEVKEVKEVKKKLKKESIDISAWFDSLKNNSAYSHINLTVESGKMDAWLSANPGRKKSKAFILNWLNKIPVTQNQNKESLPSGIHYINGVKYKGLYKVIE